ncbi:hypothetical protein BC829DRAFT_416702 [Chytridium lagenaria]|nr:hypothetical protein BC829DRAFT_416702 [Chytridium lagenaria]
MKKNDKYQFEIGDQVWFSMPLRTDKQGREDSQIKKFQFRWSGPMRVIARSEDFNRYTVVEVLPDGRLLSRQANAARLRPYNNIPPNDTADKAAKEFAVLQRRPKMKVAEGVNRELFKRFDSDVAEGQYDDPEFYVEKLEDHALEDGEYEYKVKWLGQGPYHNTWLLEREIPVVIVRDYWNDVAKKNVKEYFKRLAHVEIWHTKTSKTNVDDLNNEDIIHNDDSYDDVNPVKLVTRPLAENKKRAKDDDIPLALEDFVFTTLY